LAFGPTVNGNDRTIEVYLFDFNRNIYDETINVEFVEWIREERKFETIDLMIEEIARDVKTAKELL
jgi:riboflavin kinase/FMN adenylyltransferase